MEPVEVPDRGHLDGEMRVVGQDRQPGLGAGTADNPIVGADPAETASGEVPDRSCSLPGADAGRVSCPQDMVIGGWVCAVGA